MAIDIHNAVRRLVKAATGDEYGDGCIVSDMGTGISEPGYGDESTVWVAGNWNPKRFRRNDEPPLTNDESRPERLAAALERLGVELLWSDEWITCDDCYQAIRNNADSYSWQPYFVWAEDGDGPMCLDCYAKHYSDDDSGLRDFGYVNNAERAVPDALASDSQLSAWGWTRHNGVFEHGWHPGQTDNPREIFDAIRDESPDTDVVFRLDETSQFYVRFTVWLKPAESDEE